MEGLKVAIASDWFYPKVGGIETHIHELASNLARAGHEPHVITHDYRGYGEHFDDSSLPYAVHRFRGLVYVKRYHVSLGPGMLVEVNRLYKRIGFDVTHVHSVFSPLSIAVANLSRGIRDVPVVATSHSFFSWSRGSIVLLPFLRRLLRRVDSFIAVSTPIYRDLKRLLGGSLGDRSIYLVPNGVDTGFWRQPEPEERERARRSLGFGSEPVVIAVGRMTRRKMMHAVPRLAAEAARLSGRRPSLLLVGDGELRGRVLEEVERHRSAFRRVVVSGFVTRARLRCFYWASDVIAMPSQMEAMGLAAAEAAATGLPVIGFRGTGLQDVVVDGETGFLVRSYEEAAERLARLLANDDMRKRMGEAAAERVQRLFSWHSVLPEILKVYKATMDYAGCCDKRYMLYRIWRAIKG